MAARVELTPGYLLHRREYRDTSFLLDVWTEQYGRVSLVARGMRGPKSRFHAVQPFQRVLLSWSGRGDLGSLSALEVDTPSLQLQGVLAISGLYLNELLTLLVHKHDPNPELFADYENALKVLSALSQSSDENDLLTEEQVVLRIFEKRLLEALGYGINFDIEINTGREILSEAWYRYDVENGFHLSGPEANHTFLGGNLLSYGRETFDDMNVLKDAKRIMRTALNYHLGGKELKSRELRIAMVREKKQT